MTLWPASPQTRRRFLPDITWAPRISKMVPDLISTLMATPLPVAVEQMMVLETGCSKRDASSFTGQDSAPFTNRAAAFVVRSAPLLTPELKCVRCPTSARQLYVKRGCGVEVAHWTRSSVTLLMAELIFAPQTGSGRRLCARCTAVGGASRGTSVVMHTVLTSSEQSEAAI
mmetsp:Transcript_43672/g.100783  ORF Transcript_43672/g.100783 Transcript_43672/m.100783 type:complete len:171 (+) Transcript_43672:195-707(+)